ncbi:MAG: hypothetical protein EZS28_006021 [Streblomastix strix]|uniref:Uncharacterized protein n=1 Tax=Streblomastix strix TaxID=222440 RepID=A0A5J4WTY5_9EUKA|nr:MAG: hypothetical protein EZS28_006021 [Streblomastix strix]
MSACANAIKYAFAYWDFKLDQVFTPKYDYTSDTSNNIKESDCAFYRKLFLSTGCHICKARFTSKNPPTLDRINNDIGHSADNKGLQLRYRPHYDPSFNVRFQLLISQRYELRAAQVHQIYRMHYICGDTDSMTWAIGGNPSAEEGYRKKFKYVVKDQKFFDENQPLFFGQYKQYLEVCYEAEGTACISLTPKIHYIYINPYLMKKKRIIIIV